MLQGVPPGIPSQTFTNQMFQQSLAGLTPAQQQALLAQQQAIIAQQQQAEAARQQQQQGAANNSQQDYQAIQQQLQQRQAAEKRSSDKFATSYNSAFDPPNKGAAPGVANCPPGNQPAPFTQNGPTAQQDQRTAPVEQQQQQQQPQQPAFSGQSAPMEQQDWNMKT